jgi:hypothetical protein
MSSGQWEAVTVLILLARQHWSKKPEHDSCVVHVSEENDIFPGLNNLASLELSRRYPLLEGQALILGPEAPFLGLRLQYQGLI